MNIVRFLFVFALFAFFLSLRESMAATGRVTWNILPQSRGRTSTFYSSRHQAGFFFVKKVHNLSLTVSSVNRQRKSLRRTNAIEYEAKCELVTSQPGRHIGSERLDASRDKDKVQVKIRSDQLWDAESSCLPSAGWDIPVASSNNDDSKFIVKKKTDPKSSTDNDIK